ncbi:anaphase-promoting complex subunit cdc20-like [Zophobas morio]|uniref:anaphase-promoting complex subunit cdc20-like n=1 Tax=Zophobas morio TaxID=2755281 RepID=UPI0030830E60
MSCLAVYNNNTPFKPINDLHSFKTPVNGSCKKTPSGRKRQTPLADRFIPRRETSDYENSQVLYKETLFKENAVPIEAYETPLSPNSLEYHDNLQFALNTDPEAKVLAYQQKAPAPKEGHLNSNRILYSHNRFDKVKNSFQAPRISRKIPQTADKILDAPELLDDYYLNLLSWNQSTNILSVALGCSVYLWDASNGGIAKLMSLNAEDNYITSVQWVNEGNVLALGTDTREVQLWDAAELKLLRVMHGHSSRVGSLSWNQHLLSSGSRSGEIHFHDVRVHNHLLARCQGHSQEVCGLQWSPGNTQLASGGNDNVLNIWDPHKYTSPLFSLTDHQAAVKALAWCPWQSSLLASGGGTADRTIRFWNTQTGHCQNVIDTKSQVCSLLWAKHQRELLSSHGFSLNQLCIWKYPSAVKIAELTGHTSRVLHTALSPDGQTVVSAAADETLRFWKCFEEDKLRITNLNKMKIQNFKGQPDSGAKIR